MRLSSYKNFWLIGALAVVLTGFNFYISQQGHAKLEAFGQANGSPQLILQTEVDGKTRRPFAFVLDPQTQRLSAYSATESGIVFLGTRLIEYDMKFEEFPTTKSSSKDIKSVQNIKKLVKAAAQAGTKKGNPNSSPALPPTTTEGLPGLTQ